MNSESRIAEINEFLGFVVGRWPEKRQHVRDQLTPRCSACILNERFTPLNENGLCSACASYVPRGETAARENRQEESALAAVLRSHAGKGAVDYDAVVLFSGGKDSAFLLHRLRQEFPDLRLAALTVNNGFMSQVALKNCESIMCKLEGIDHFVMRPPEGLYAKAFRHAFTHLDEQGCYAKVDRMDGDLTFDIGRNFAARLEAPLLISGLSPEQVERILGLHGYESPPSLENQQRTHSAGFELEELYTEDERQRYWWAPQRWLTARRPRVLHPFHAWHYDEEFVPQEVVRLGLIEAGQDNPLATNNDTVPVMLAVDYSRLGYSSFEPEFAQLVREGRADRTMWLAMFECIEYLVSRGKFLPGCISDTLGRLGLSATELGVPDLRNEA